MKKNIRHDRILQLIEEIEICTQEELTERLLSEGFNVSQSTVSRDINELNLIKVEGVNKKYKYASSGGFTSELPVNIINLFKQVTLSIDCANNLIVIKTYAGNANTAGTAVDQMHFPQILGTIAGDDTLLIVARSNSDAEFIMKSLKVL